MVQLEELILIMDTDKWGPYNVPPTPVGGIQAINTLRFLTFRAQALFIPHIEEAFLSFCVKVCGELVVTLFELYPNVPNAYLESTENLYRNHVFLLL